MQFFSHFHPERGLALYCSDSRTFSWLVNKMNCRKVYRNGYSRKTFQYLCAKKNGDCVKRHTEITFKRSEYFCNTKRLDKRLALHAGLTKNNFNDCFQCERKKSTPINRIRCRLFSFVGFLAVQGPQNSYQILNICSELSFRCLAIKKWRVCIDFKQIQLIQT